MERGKLKVRIPNEHSGDKGGISGPLLKEILIRLASQKSGSKYWSNKSSRVDKCHPVNFDYYDFDFTSEVSFPGAGRMELIFLAGSFCASG